MSIPIPVFQPVLKAGSLKIKSTGLAYKRARQAPGATHSPEFASLTQPPVAQQALGLITLLISVSIHAPVIPTTDNFSTEKTSLVYA